MTKTARPAVPSAASRSSAILRNASSGGVGAMKPRSRLPVRGVQESSMSIVATLSFSFGR